MRTQLERISHEYLAMQRELHSRPEGYGGKGKKWAPTVLAMLQHFNASSVLDYGCGEGSLANELQKIKKKRPKTTPYFRMDEYDPAIPGKDQAPGFADLVIITDVLEHVEPERLTAVLDHVRMLARKAVFFVVALDPANKILLDGRNAHLIMASPEWWAETVAAAGFTFSPVLNELPLPMQYTPEKRSKRWIAVGIPC